MSFLCGRHWSKVVIGIESSTGFSVLEYGVQLNVLHNAKGRFATSDVSLEHEVRESCVLD